MTAPRSGADLDERALELVRAANRAGAAAGADPAGYVALQDIAYRGHHLLARAVLARAGAGATVLEGGVSSGYFARVLTEAGMIVDGFELDPVAAARARTVCREVWVGDLQQIDPATLNGPYDVLLFGDTLEHVPDPVAVLRRLRRVLTDDGALVVSLPNFANWAVRLQVLAGRFRYSDRGILDRTHLRFFTERLARELFDEAGYRVDSLVGAIPVPLVTQPALCRLAHRAGNLRPSLFAYNFIVTGSPV